MKKTIFCAMAFVAAVIATMSVSSCKQEPATSDNDSIDSTVVVDTDSVTIDSVGIDTALIGPEA